MNNDNVTPNVSPSNRDALAKWGALSIAALVVIGGGYGIYAASSAANGGAVSTVMSTPVPTVVPNASDLAAQGAVAPDTVSSPTDLATADMSLDSSDITSLSTELDQNDRDLATF